VCLCVSEAVLVDWRAWRRGRVLVQVFDASGNNMALASAGTRCYSRTIDWGGDPACLNDGVTGNYPAACNSHSDFSVGNFDICVFSAPVAVSRVVVHPFVDPDQPWMTDRISSLSVKLYASVSGIAPGNGAAPAVIGAPLASYAISTFSSTNFAPHVGRPTLLTSIPCPATTTVLPSFTYQSEYTNVGASRGCGPWAVGLDVLVVRACEQVWGHVVGG
jgi:hypothetical protein